MATVAANFPPTRYLPPPPPAGRLAGAATWLRHTTGAAGTATIDDLCRLLLMIAVEPPA